MAIGILGLVILVGLVILLFGVPLTLILLLVTLRRDKRPPEPEDEDSLPPTHSLAARRFAASASAVSKPTPQLQLAGEANRTVTYLPDPAETASPVPFLSPPRAPDELGRLAHYRVLKELGRGGMGMVFLAEDETLGRPVALKVLQPELAANEQAQARFLREARAAALLKHEHVITIYQVGEDRGVPFLAMEYLTGSSLEERLKREPPLTFAEIVRVGREIALGLAAAHERGLIHRDIKPANVWLEAPGDRVKILDFGLARLSKDDLHLTKSGTLLGTPQYMAPEQAAGGGDLDGRCDLYSLGCVLYRMCTGQLPFRADSIMALLTAIALETPTPVRELSPQTPAPLADLITRLLAKKPDERPQTAHEVAEALAALAAPGGAAPAPARPEAIRLGAAPNTPATLETVPLVARPAPPARGGPKYLVIALLAVAGLGIVAAGLVILACLGVVPAFFVLGRSNAVATRDPDQLTEIGRAVNDLPRQRERAEGIDLLEKIVPEQDVVAGVWKVEQQWALNRGEQCVVHTPEKTPEAPFPRLVLPYQPLPEWYDLELDVIRRQDGGSLNVGFVVEACRTMLVLDRAADAGSASGLELVDERRADDNETTHKGSVLPLNQKKTVRLSVRRDEVTCAVDGLTVVRWAGIPKRLTLPEDWKVGGRQSLFLGSEARFEVSRMRLLPIEAGPGPPPEPPRPGKK